jgi:hypothetical protein
VAQAASQAEELVGYDPAYAAGLAAERAKVEKLATELAARDAQHAVDLAAERAKVEKAIYPGRRHGQGRTGADREGDRGVCVSGGAARCIGGRAGASALVAAASGLSLRCVGSFIHSLS